MVDILDHHTLLDFRNYLRHIPSTGQKCTPLDILKKRLARGEINKEEYEEKKKEVLTLY